MTEMAVEAGWRQGELGEMQGTDVEGACGVEPFEHGRGV